MSRLSPEARALIEEARPHETPACGAHTRVRSKVLARVSAGAAVGTAATLGASTSAAKTAASAGLVAKWIAVMGVMGSAAFGAGAGARYLAEGLAPSPRVVTSASASPGRNGAGSATGAALRDEPAQKPAAEMPVDSSKPDSPLPLPSTRPTVPPSSAPRRADPGARLPSPGSSLEAETELLRRAQAELRSGNADKALEVLDEHKAGYEHGLLGEERAASRILALCALGRVAEARVEAQQFLRTSPRSPMASRVRSSCGGEPEP